MSEGKCFICKEAGHMSHQCPKRTNVPSNRRDRPPGVPSYAMHVDTGETERLRVLADSTESIEELTVGSMQLECEGEVTQDNGGWTNTDSWDWPSESGSDQDGDRSRYDLTSKVTPAPLGDPLARRAEELLAINTPYPGDDISNGETFLAGRFTVYRTSETHHVIMDGA
jgi:hypothetical protein